MALLVEDVDIRAGSACTRLKLFYPYPPNLDLLRSFLNPSPLLLIHLNYVRLKVLILRWLYPLNLYSTKDRLLKRVRSM